MSGFERSAPIPGSQGPRRSEMRRYNNAPPPESPWRLEVLEAKKQAEAAVRKATQRSKSRSRSRDRERDRERRKGGAGTSAAGGSASSSSGGKKVEQQPQDTSKEAIFKKIVKAREVGEGWFAAVSAASSRWDSIPEHKRPPGAKGVGAPAVASQKSKDDRRRPDMEDRDKERKAKEDKARAAKEIQEESERRAEQRREKERLEKVWAAEAEEREKRRLEEKKRMEDDRRKKEQDEKQRKKKLGNAFCVDGDEDENEIQKREAQLLKKAADRKKNLFEEPAPGPPVMTQAMSMVGIGDSKNDRLESEFAGRLGFEGCLDPAEAFIRLQERKRKGRRAEFGGPPRGCSPWRDGKRGVVTPLAEKDRDRDR